MLTKFDWDSTLKSEDVNMYNCQKKKVDITMSIGACNQTCNCGNCGAGGMPSTKCKNNNGKQLKDMLKEVYKN